MPRKEASKKANALAYGALMKVLHDMLLPRSGAAAIPCSARTLLIVLRRSSCPRFLSASRRRVYPHVGFSCATCVFQPS